MSFLIQAPHELPEAAVLLPSPNYGDTKNLNNTVDLKRTMNGTKRTYIKTNPDLQFKYEFVLRKGKAVELYEFYRYYCASTVRIRDHYNAIYFGYIVNDPFQLQFGKRFDVSVVQIEFRGKLYG